MRVNGGLVAFLAPQSADFRSQGVFFDPGRRFFRVATWKNAIMALWK